MGLDIAYRMVAPVLLGLMIGLFIDKQFGTSPWGMLGLLIFGIITGFWSIFKVVYFPEGGIPPQKPIHPRTRKSGQPKSLDDESKA